MYRFSISKYDSNVIAILNYALKKASKKTRLKCANLEILNIFLLIPIFIIYKPYIISLI